MNDTHSSIATRRIGLFGGSFDPPHRGHVALVQAGLAMGLDEVWVIPALPVHRKLSGKADGMTRLLWLQQVFENESRVQVLDWEVSQCAPVASVDTLRRFQATYPNLVPWLMLGMDAWADFTSWREYPAHQKLCNVLVFARQDDHAALEKGRHPAVHHKGWQVLDREHWSDCMEAGHYYKLAVSLPAISATSIRNRTALGLSLDGIVPKVLQSDIEKRYMNE